MWPKQRGHGDFNSTARAGVIPNISDGFPKKVWMGVGGWGELYQLFWNLFNFAKPLIKMHIKVKFTKISAHLT